MSLRFVALMTAAAFALLSVLTPAPAEAQDRKSTRLNSSH